MEQYFQKLFVWWKLIWRVLILSVIAGYWMKRIVENRNKLMKKNIIAKEYSCKNCTGIFFHCPVIAVISPDIIFRGKFMERSKKQGITKNDDNLEWNFETRKEHQHGIFNTNNSAMNETLNLTLNICTSIRKLIKKKLSKISKTNYIYSYNNNYTNLIKLKNHHLV